MQAFLPPGHLGLVATHYGLGSVHEVRRLGGLSAQNWLLVTAAGRFVLKRFAPQGCAQHEATARLLEALARAAFPAPRCVVPVGQQSTSLRAGDDAYALHVWRAGEVRHGYAVTTSALQAVARTLAELHRLGPQLASEVPSLRTLPAPDATAARQTLQLWQARLRDAVLPADAHQAIVCSLAVKRAFLRTTAPEFSISDGREHDLVHGDFHNENVLFDDADNVSGVVDLETAGLGDGLGDVFTFILLCCCATGLAQPELARANVFVRAYVEASGRPLGGGELARGWHQAFFRLATSLFFEDRALRGERDAQAYLLRDVARMRAYLEAPEGLVGALRG